MLSSNLVHSLIAVLHAIDESQPAEEEELSLIHSPCRTLEGVWPLEGMLDMRVLTQSLFPFRIITASKGWLDFCGFRLEDVVGRTFRIVQGAATERRTLGRILATVPFAARGKTLRFNLTQYTKSGIAFRNHICIERRKSCSASGSTNLNSFVVITTAVDILEPSSPTGGLTLPDHMQPGCAPESDNDTGSTCNAHCSGLVEP